MKLVELGKLSLDDKAFSILSDIRPHSGHFGDPRISVITIRNLLTHSGGWDAATSGDPIVAPFSQQIAGAMGVAFPPTPAAIISFLLDRPLDFDPGTRFAYSNFGFLILGRVIEQVSGEPFGDFVQQQILSPLRIRRMRLGRTPLSLRIPGEVLYYDYPGAPLVDSLIPGEVGEVTEPYSGIVALESIDSAGGWIASAIDLVRLVTMLDGWGVPTILTPDSVQQMVTPVFTIPGIGLDAGTPFYVGLGIGMDSPASDATWAHDGGTFGTRAFICRPGHGWAWAVTFNSAPKSTLYSSTGSSDFDTTLRRLFSREALESVSWFGGDLFRQYLPPVRHSKFPGRSPL
jgi:N-acyl-D-amino-acid deacylase